MRYTVLSLVQMILAAMDSDEVSNINDTVESAQVALLLRSTFYDMATELGLPDHETSFELTASGDNTKPTLMTLPTNVVTLREVRYDNKLTGDDYSVHLPVEFMPFADFITMQNALSTMDDDVGEMTVSMNDEDFPVLYRSDKMPNFYTTVNDYQLIFDSYDSDEDTTLVKAKTWCLGNVYPDFELVDDFIPEINPSQFSYFFNKAKTRAFNELKQMANMESAQEQRNQKIVVQKRKRRTPNIPEVERVARYGRK